MLKKIINFAFISFYVGPAAQSQPTRACRTGYAALAQQPAKTYADDANAVVLLDERKPR